MKHVRINLPREKVTVCSSVISGSPAVDDDGRRAWLMMIDFRRRSAMFGSQLRCARAAGAVQCGRPFYLIHACVGEDEAERRMIRDLKSLKNSVLLDTRYKSLPNIPHKPPPIADVTWRPRSSMCREDTQTDEPYKQVKLLLEGVDLSPRLTRGKFPRESHGRGNSE
ncbi:hypothetical protein EVAR_67652_1 [Eumeta japonica]|uniref:Uncharacterized protein n=1 Tax=Eumeta variegata TaxID=151549 RepID=A0A4C1ZA59_EUMVA|nr:hypothetical protein EVAR_67652_1 [Eumeta japonica]